MKYRKLRIAWSVAFGIVCLLLIVMWVRSYSRDDFVSGPVSNLRFFDLNSHKGRVAIAWVRMPGFNMQWRVYSFQSGLEKMSSAWWHFRFDKPSRSWEIAVPYWFNVALAAAVTALPWLRWRFSLRTLLVAMTLAAVGLGAIVYAMR